MKRQSSFQLNGPWLACVATLVGVLLAQGCVEPFDLGLKNSVTLLTVDGRLTNLNEPQFVRIRRSLPSDEGPLSEAWRGARAEVLVEGTQVLPLTERRPGDYFLPDGFRAEPGRTYQLRFRNPDGTQYESTPERMPVPKPIERIYDQFDPEAVRVPRFGEIPVVWPGHRLFLATQDPADTRDFYNCSWKSWEEIQYCVSCGQALYSRSLGECYSPVPPPLQLENDYSCERRCWQQFGSSRINLFADTYANGRPIPALPVAQLPYYAARGALVEIELQALTAGAFRYFKLLSDQTQNTGGLADTPPASIFGNVRNANQPSEQLVGYFTVVGLTRQRYWLDRQNVPAGNRPIGFFGGRAPSPPAYDPFLPSTLAPCDGPFRTPLMPDGWRD